MKSSNKDRLHEAFEWRPANKNTKETGYYVAELSNDFKIMVEPLSGGGAYTALFRRNELIADRIPKRNRRKISK